MHHPKRYMNKTERAALLYKTSLNYHGGVPRDVKYKTGENKMEICRMEENIPHRNHPGSAGITEQLMYE